MIYFVDEEATIRAKMRAVKRVCRMETTWIRNADDAVDLLCQANDIEFVFVDMMLAARMNGDQSRFSKESTKDFQLCGLSLATELAKELGKPIHSRIAYLTQLTEAHKQHTPEITRNCSRTGIRWLKKSDYASAQHFAEEVTPLVQPFSGDFYRQQLSIDHPVSKDLVTADFSSGEESHD